MNHTKVTSIRMPVELAAQIGAVARTEGVSVSEMMPSGGLPLHRHSSSRSGLPRAPEQAT